MSYVLVIGAKSDIAKEIAKVYAIHGYDLHLAARQSSELKEFANDIIVRTQRKIMIHELDVMDYESHQAFYDLLAEKPVGVISAVGCLGDQSKAQIDFQLTKLIIDTNYTGIVSLFNIIANDFETRRSGFLIGISSVAGDRGRKSNYVYGSAKAAITTYLSGLRNRLYCSNVHVMTVKPGFVATKMIEGMDVPVKLTARPEKVAYDIYNAQQKSKDVLYTKWIWRWIMLIIKTLPERIFKRTGI